MGCRGKSHPLDMFGDGDSDLKCPNLRSGAFQPVHPSVGEVAFLWSASMLDHNHHGMGVAQMF